MRRPGFRGVHHVSDQQPEARGGRRRAVIVHGSQRALRDENREEPGVMLCRALDRLPEEDRKSTRLNSSHLVISYAVFCLKKKKKITSRTVTMQYSLHFGISP